MMNLGAGLKWGAIAVIVLGVGLTSYYVIQSVKATERTKITLELEKKTEEKHDDIRNAITKSKPVDNNDASTSLRYLESR